MKLISINSMLQCSHQCQVYQNLSFTISKIESLNHNYVSSSVLIPSSATDHWPKVTHEFPGMIRFNKRQMIAWENIEWPHIPQDKSYVSHLSYISRSTCLTVVFPYLLFSQQSISTFVGIAKLINSLKWNLKTKKWNLNLDPSKKLLKNTMTFY